MISSPKFVTVTGRPLSGKTHLIKLLLRSRNDFEIFKGKSFTTRPARAGDVPGEYQHVSDSKFDHLLYEGEFLWTAPHGDYRVGTKRDDVVTALKSEKVSVMTLVPKAVSDLIAFVGREKVVSFFIESTDKDSLARLSSRGGMAGSTLDRFNETKDWKLDMVRNGVLPFYIRNPNDDPPGATALGKMLVALEMRGL